MRQESAAMGRCKNYDLQKRRSGQTRRHRPHCPYCALSRRDERADWQSDCPFQKAISVIHHGRSEEHTSELQSLMRISYAVFCLKKTNTRNTTDILTREKRQTCKDR